MMKPIILIGGASGTGKTSLGSALRSKFDIDHSLGTGFIRAVIQSETTKAQEPLLFTRTSQSEDPIMNLKVQAKRLKRAVLRCINRARVEGTSLIIEGSHLLPEIYHDSQADLFMVLTAEGEEQHRARIMGHRHNQRKIDQQEFEGARVINQYYQETAAKYGIRLVEFGDNLDEIMALLPND